MGVLKDMIGDETKLVTNRYHFMIIQDNKTTPASFLFRKDEPLKKIRDINDGSLSFCSWYHGNNNFVLEKIRRIKMVSDNDFHRIDCMINLSLDYLELCVPFGYFDCIIQIPTTSNLGPLIFNKIQQRIPAADSLNKVLIKNPFNKLIFSNEFLNEKSEKGKDLLNGYKNSCHNNSKPAMIKKIKASLRRHVDNLFTFGENAYLLNNKRRILLCDDTLGEGVTFANAIRMIKSISPNARITCFTLVHDYSCCTKYINSKKLYHLVLKN